MWHVLIYYLHIINLFIYNNNNANWREKCVVTKAKSVPYSNMAADRESLSRTNSEAVSRAVTDALNATLSPVGIDNIRLNFL